MAIRFYDEAIYNKIQKWVIDPNMRILKPDETSRLFQMKSDQNNDKPLKLPIISIVRSPSLNIDLSTKRNLSYDGERMDASEALSLHLDAIPITINYQINIYTKRFDEGDEYLRNFIFNIINHPKLYVNIPYNNVNLQHVCFMRLNPTVADTSNVSEKLFSDEFTRWTLEFTLQDAYLFGAPVNENGEIVSVDLDLCTHSDESKIIDEIEEVDVKNISENK